MKEYSPYITFNRKEWAQFRKDTPLTLNEQDLDNFRGINDKISMDEVVDVYLPMSRLINLYVAASMELHQATYKFLGGPAAKVPFIIGLAGSVAVGKSTTARILQALLSRWRDHVNVALITTDGFLYPNASLQDRGLMRRKGFPESYDVRRLIKFVADLKAGKPSVAAPVYSHLTYDILPDEMIEVTEPDIVILEGINVLQSAPANADKPSQVYLSDFFDFSIYVDADINQIEHWFLDRFHTLRDTAFKKPESYFHRYASMSREEADQFARGIWDEINAVNLLENIQPSRERADLILYKGANHAVEEIKLRKL